jgi:PAS domain-containing protein
VTQKKKNGLSGNWDHVLAPEGFSGTEPLLRAFLSAPNVGLAICDEQLRYYAINHALAAMNGVSAEHHIGKTVREVLGDAAGKIESALSRFSSPA